MQYFRLTIITLSMFAFFSCAEPEKIEGTLLEKATNAQVNYKGMAAEEIIVYADNVPLVNNIVGKGASVQVKLNNIRGLKVINEKVSWGCELKIIDDQNTLLLDNPDVVKNIKQLNKDSVRYMSIFITVPINTPAVGIMCKMRFFDKNESTSEVVVIMKLLLRNPDNPTGLVSAFMAGGTSIEKTILTSLRYGVVFGQEVEYGDSLLMNVINPKGFDAIADKWSLGCELTVTNEKEELVIGAADLFKDMNLLDISNTKLLNGSLIITEPMKRGEIYTWKSRFFDKRKVDRSITVFYKFKVK